MIKSFLIVGFLFSLVLFFPNSAYADPESDVLGLRLGMSKEAAHKILKKIGKLEKNESKQQEVWALSDERRFSYIIIAFDKEYTEVRFITAKARENGRRVRYDEVLNVKKARQAGSSANLNYIQDVPASGKKAAYKIVARGTDPKFLTYFSLEKYYQ